MNHKWKWIYGNVQTEAGQTGVASGRFYGQVANEFSRGLNFTGPNTVNSASCDDPRLNILSLGGGLVMTGVLSFAATNVAN